MRLTRNQSLPALTLMELLVVLAIIGIIVMMAMPRFMNVVSDARSLEAQQQLKYLHTLQKAHFMKNAKYGVDLAEVGFEQEKLATHGGQAMYEIEILSASPSGYTAVARAVVDFDQDGTFNEWTIDHDQNIKETIAD